MSKLTQSLASRLDAGEAPFRAKNPEMGGGSSRRYHPGPPAYDRPAPVTMSLLRMRAAERSAYPRIDRVPKPQHLQLSIGQRVAQLVTPHDDASHLMRLEPFEPHTQPWLLCETTDGDSDRLDKLCSGWRMALGEEGVQAHEVAKRRSAPDHPQAGTGSGLSLLRLSAQALTASCGMPGEVCKSAKASSVSR